MSLSDEKRSKPSNYTPKSPYLGFIEFFLAETDKDNQQQATTIRNSRKWTENKIVDTKILARYHQIVEKIFNIIQEYILLSQINRINVFTNYLPLAALFEHSDQHTRLISSLISSFATSTPNYSLILQKKKSIIDMKTLRALTEDNQINWSSSMNYLYPIQTIADGNCLCHAVLSYLTGMQDTNLALRETLKSFFNEPNYSHELKFRWKINRENFYSALKIEFDKDEMEKEWAEISNMQKTIQTQQQKTTKTQLTGLPSLIFLEDIHVFALANLLMRPIIVISPKNISDIQQCDLRGVYLPLLKRPNECVKDPILIAYYNFHFMPLVFAMDEETEPQTVENIDIPMTENNYHFQNLDAIESNYLSNEEFDKMYRFNKHRKSNFLNAVPLIDFNLEQIKVHFLKEKEENNQMTYLKLYLNLFKAEIAFNEYKQFHVEYFETENKPFIQIFCCHLARDTRNLANNGIETYIKFLNESITIGERSNSSSTTMLSKSITETTLNTENRPQTPPRSNANLIPKYMRKSCKTVGCSKYALEAKGYYGYCDSCFSREILSKSINETKNLEDELSERLDNLEEASRAQKSALRQAEMKKLEEVNRKVEIDRSEYNEYQFKKCFSSDCIKPVRSTKFGSSKYCEACTGAKARERPLKYTSLESKMRGVVPEPPSMGVSIPINIEMMPRHNNNNYNNYNTTYNHSSVGNSNISAYNFPDTKKYYGDSVHDRTMRSPSQNNYTNTIFTNTPIFRKHCVKCGRLFDSIYVKTGLCEVCLDKNVSGIYC